MMRSLKLKVLITGAGTVTCRSLIKGLRQQSEIEVHITTVDPDPRSVGRYLGDAFDTVPSAGDPGFVPALLKLVRRHRIQLLIPIVDSESRALAENREQFQQLGCRVAISPPGTIAFCDEKEKTYRFFVQSGVATPKTWLPSELPDPIEIPYPILVRPRTGGSYIDAHKISAPDEFYFWQKRVEDPLYQEYVEGEEYTIDVLSNFQGQVIGAVPCLQVETKAGVPYKTLTVRDPKMVNAGRFIAERAGTVGPFTIRCFKAPRGLVCLEINPRFSDNLPLVIAAGFNAPLLLAKCALGWSVTDVDDFEDGLLMLRFWDEMFVNKAGEVRADIRLPKEDS